MGRLPRPGDQNPWLYLGIGALSLAKAALLRRIGRPAGRDLRDAGLFIGIGLALRTYQRRRVTRAGTGTTGEDGATGGTEDAAETEETGETGAAESAEGSGADEPVVVAGPDERGERGTEGDRRRPTVADAVRRLSPPPTLGENGRS